MKKFFITALLACSISAFAAETLFRLPMEEAEFKKITTSKKFTLQEVEGKKCLYLKPYSSVQVKLPDELAQFEGEHVRITYRYRMKNVPKPAKPHLGFKVMALYQYDNNKKHHGHAASPSGTKEWTWEGYNFLIKKDAKNFSLAIVQPAAGEVWITDVTVTYQTTKGK